MATDNKPKGLVVISEYLKISGLNYSPKDFAALVSTAPDAFLQNIGTNYVIGLDSDIDRLSEALYAVYDRAGQNIPDSQMFFDAIYAAANANKNWDIIRTGFVQGVQEIGSEAALFAQNSADLVKLANRVLPLVAVTFLAAFLITQYKKIKS